MTIWRWSVAMTPWPGFNRNHSSDVARDTTNSSCDPQCLWDSYALWQISRDRWLRSTQVPALLLLLLLGVEILQQRKSGGERSTRVSPLPLWTQGDGGEVAEPEELSVWPQEGVILLHRQKLNCKPTVQSTFIIHGFGTHGTDSTWVPPHVRTASLYF